MFRRSASHHHRKNDQYSKYLSHRIQREYMDMEDSYLDYQEYPVYHQTLTASPSTDESNLERLITTFHQIEPSIVRDIFVAKDYDVCQTAIVLSEFITPSPPQVHHQEECESEQSFCIMDPLEQEQSFCEYEMDMEIPNAEWVVVQDDWEVVDSVDDCVKSYCEALKSSSVDTTTPSPQFLSPQKSTTSTKLSNHTDESDKDHTEKSKHIDDYYGIKEFGQRRSHQDRCHPRKRKSSSRRHVK